MTPFFRAAAFLMEKRPSFSSCHFVHDTPPCNFLLQIVTEYHLISVHAIYSIELQTGNYPPPEGGSHMKQKILRSPFAARLLLLTAVLLLSCCVLASCQVEPAEQTDDPVIENAPSGEGLESNATAPQTGDPFSSEDSFADYVTDSPEESDPTSGSLHLPDEHFVLLPVGKPVSVDLNGDGTPETLLVDLIQGGDSPSYALSVNGSDYYTTLTQLGIHVDCPQEQFAVTDLDAGDNHLEIALADEGPSNDPHTIFLRWDGTDLISLGEVYGMVSDGDLTFLGGGVVDSYFRLSVLQTWCAPVLWRFNPTGEFGIVHQDLYYPFPYSETQIVTALKDLAAYADRNTESERTILPAGTKFTLTATDNARWVQCADESSKQFWLQLDETSGHKVELSDGSYSWGALDGLNLAD